MTVNLTIDCNMKVTLEFGGGAELLVNKVNWGCTVWPIL